MAKETQKAKIERLEQEIMQLKEEKHRCEEDRDAYYARIQELQDTADEAFQASPLYKQLLNDIELQKVRAETSERRLEINQDIRGKQAERILKLENDVQELINEQPQVIKNARGAGRKPKFTEKDLKRAKELRKSGLSIRKIALELGYSASLISRKIKEENYKN